jgi:hypothetical protein
MYATVLVDLGEASLNEKENNCNYLYEFSRAGCFLALENKRRGDSGENIAHIFVR